MKMKGIMVAPTGSIYGLTFNMLSGGQLSENMNRILNLKTKQIIEMLKPNVSIGDRLLRLSEADDDCWMEFTVNETYLKLIEEYPEDYRNLDKTPISLCVAI